MAECLEVPQSALKYHCRVGIAFVEMCHQRKKGRRETFPAVLQSHAKLQFPLEARPVGNRLALPLGGRCSIFVVGAVGIY